MKPQPTPPSDREAFAGLVERVTYQNAENGFCVIWVKARGHSDLITVVGHAAIISAGEWITASGDWVNDRTHGQQFKARFLKTSAPNSVEGIKKYLASGMIRGIGPVYAEKLLRAFSRSQKRPAEVLTTPRQARPPNREGDGSCYDDNTPQLETLERDVDAACYDFAALQAELEVVMLVAIAMRLVWRDLASS